MNHQYVAYLTYQVSCVGMVLLDVGQAADALGVSHVQVGRLIDAGELDAERFGRSAVSVSSLGSTARSESIAVASCSVPIDIRR